jgi:hypothetical protein
VCGLVTLFQPNRTFSQDLLTAMGNDIKKNLSLIRILIDVELWLKSIKVPKVPLLKI